MTLPKMLEWWRWTENRTLSSHRQGGPSFATTISCKTFGRDDGSWKRECQRQRNRSCFQRASVHVHKANEVSQHTSWTMFPWITALSLETRMSYTKFDAFRPHDKDTILGRVATNFSTSALMETCLPRWNMKRFSWLCNYRKIHARAKRSPGVYHWEVVENPKTRNTKQLYGDEKLRNDLQAIVAAEALSKCPRKEKVLTSIQRHESATVWATSKWRL